MTQPQFDLPVLYSFRRCPYAMRARLALYTSGHAVELREILLRDKPDHFRSLSEKATVPVLWLADGGVVDESLEIMRWALAAPPRLAQGFDLELEQLDLPIVATIDGPFKHHLDRYKYAARFDGADALSHRSAAVDILTTVAVEKPSLWLAGDQPGLVDLAVLPFIRQFRIADPDWFDDAEELKPIAKWLAAFLALPELDACMQKYSVWQSGEAGVLFTRPME
jgi:glutathione S-transferase